MYYVGVMVSPLELKIQRIDRIVFMYYRSMHESKHGIKTQPSGGDTLTGRCLRGGRRVYNGRSVCAGTGSSLMPHVIRAVLEGLEALLQDGPLVLAGRGCCGLRSNGLLGLLLGRSVSRCLF